MKEQAHLLERQVRNRLEPEMRPYMDIYSRLISIHRVPLNPNDSCDRNGEEAGIIWMD